MIQLYKFPGNNKLESSSPFCLKVELYLKLNNIPYTSKVTGNPNKSPKGKLPYIDHDGVIISDSSFIMDYLESKFPIMIGHDLSSTDQSLGHCMDVLCNEHLYWAMVHMRWVNKKNSIITKDIFFKTIPKAIRNLIFNMVQSKVKKQLLGHGFGRHSEEEIVELAIKDITSLSFLLNDKAYFFGDKVTRYDISLYSFLANFLYMSHESPIVNQLKTHDNLIRFIDRIQKQAFPENVN